MIYSDLYNKATCLKIASFLHPEENIKPIVFWDLLIRNKEVQETSEIK